MPHKTEEYIALANRTADSLSQRWEHWAEFLITASHLYKYSFPEQLMIYAQRPDATACAEYDIWVSRMNRYVRKVPRALPCWTSPEDTRACAMFSMCRTRVLE